MNEEPFTPKGGTATEAHPGAPHESGTPLKEKAGQAMHSAQSEAQRLKGSAREQSAAAMEQMKEGLHSATHQAREAGRTFIHNQQGLLAARLGEYAEAARAASERLHGGEGNMLARPAERAAEGLERLSGYLRDKEPADLMHDLESFARRRPEVVFGGLFVAGLAAARFLKASRRSLEDRDREHSFARGRGPEFSSQENFGPKPGDVSGSTGQPFAPGGPSTSGVSTPTTSPATSSIPPTTGSSTTPTIPPAPGGTSSGIAPGGTSSPSNPSTSNKPTP